MLLVHTAQWWCCADDADVTDAANAADAAANAAAAYAADAAAAAEADASVDAHIDALDVVIMLLVLLMLQPWPKVCEYLWELLSAFQCHKILTEQRQHLKL